MADLFDMRVGGAGWHLTSHLIAIAALFVACFAITGYITYRDESIPVKALDKDQDADDDIKVDNVTTKSLDVSGDATFKSNTRGVFGAGFNDISVVTAADASHTLSDADAGIVVISGNLATGSEIKLPTPTTSNLGTYFKIIIQGTLAGTCKIGLADAGTAVLVGTATVTKTTANYTTAEANQINVVTGADTQALDLDQDTATKGGAPGSVIEFYYATTAKVVVTANIFANSVNATTGADLFTDTGF